MSFFLSFSRIAKHHFIWLQRLYPICVFLILKLLPTLPTLSEKNVFLNADDAVRGFTEGSVRIPRKLREVLMMPQYTVLLGEDKVTLERKRHQKESVRASLNHHLKGVKWKVTVS